MRNQSKTAKVIDNGGRRRIRDRRFWVSSPIARERRTNWERRSGYDRRLRQMVGYADEQSKVQD